MSINDGGSTTTSIQIYFPNDLRRYFKQKQVCLLGYKLNNVYIVLDCVKDKTIEVRDNELKDLQLIGSINDDDFKFHIKLRYDEDSQLLSSSIPCMIINFDPPNFKNLEYFSIEPILLQSMGGFKSKTNALTEDKLKFYQPEHSIDQSNLSISNNQVLEKVNQICRNRLLYHRKNYNNTNIFQFVLKIIVTGLIIPFVKLFQSFIISIINFINTPIFGISLVQISKVFRHLDLRLKQFNYFPIQFLCYYDRRILYQQDSPIVNELKLPIFNTNLNINNSNYINLYNSIWLIFNDLLLGWFIYSTILTYQDKIFCFIDTIILEKILFKDMMSLITWISVKHPAGFKLNTDLGQFFGELYTWTIIFWKNHVQNLIIFKNKSILLFLSKILCFYGGGSFFICFLIDCISILTFHIFAFYCCSTKVYKKQLEIIKSLFQLFRGKKYNVLRNRLDNLNNYETGDIFEIDQLLIGTLLFMIMIFLLPTIFAFYLMFSIIHILTLMIYNLLENITIILNFTPIFVCLLKLKNSKRLQGGIKFEFLKNENNINFLMLSNISLTYSEIFVNYIKLFKRAKNFRESILLNLICGDIISFKYNYNLKFMYLMLPEEYTETISVWKYVK
ncbi:gpi1 [Candida pseudojiufengensis]|uniref:gpi1 n=1 Tax=Candida pseudojiufengensis TaxID=497109 RepID=UPI002224E182|nr:gpi1 [Candida pseudojiufengensis]KAI5960996.1 gpi1 [Candida pseudojiufengensis]